MTFYHNHMKNGKLVSDIDNEDILGHLEIVVYNAKKEYWTNLTNLDNGNF